MAAMPRNMPWMAAYSAEMVVETSRGRRTMTRGRLSGERGPATAAPADDPGDSGNRPPPKD